MLKSKTMRDLIWLCGKFQTINKIRKTELEILHKKIKRWLKNNALLRELSTPWVNNKIIKEIVRLKSKYKSKKCLLLVDCKKILEVIRLIMIQLKLWQNIGKIKT